MGDNNLPINLGANGVAETVGTAVRGALIGDLLPRNTAGIVAALAGSLGTGSVPFASLHVNELFINGSEFSVADVSGGFIVSGAARTVQLTWAASSITTALVLVRGGAGGGGGGGGAGQSYLIGSTGFAGGEGGGGGGGELAAWKIGMLTGLSVGTVLQVTLGAAGGGGGGGRGGSFVRGNRFDMRNFGVAGQSGNAGGASTARILGGSLNVSSAGGNGGDGGGGGHFQAEGFGGIRGLGFGFARPGRTNVITGGGASKANNAATQQSGVSEGAGIGGNGGAAGSTASQGQKMGQNGGTATETGQVIIIAVQLRNS